MLQFTSCDDRHLKGFFLSIIHIYLYTLLLLYGVLSFLQSKMLEEILSICVREENYRPIWKNERQDKKTVAFLKKTFILFSLQVEFYFVKTTSARSSIF